MDESIESWLDSDAYRIVVEHDAKTRRTARIARIETIPDDWADLVGEAVHNLRSALDHLAFALNAKGYADAHQGAAIPAQRESRSAFPIFGNVNQAGLPVDGEGAFKSNTSYRDMPSGAVDLIEKLQPYQRGHDFRRDPLWTVHELSRIDKHRIDLRLTANTPGVMTINVDANPGVIEMVLGQGGPVYDGKELSFWVTAPGYPEPNVDVCYSRHVAFGDGTALRDHPVVPAMRFIREYLLSEVALPLSTFL